MGSIDPEQLRRHGEFVYGGTVAFAEWNLPLRIELDQEDPCSVAEAARLAESLSTCAEEVPAFLDQVAADLVAEGRMLREPDTAAVTRVILRNRSRIVVIVKLDSLDHEIELAFDHEGRAVGWRLAA